MSGAMMHAAYSFPNDLYEIWIGWEREGRRSYVEPVTIKTLDEPCITSPSMRLTPEEAQMLMDALWRAGVKPTSEGSPGQLDALRKHLEDMRSIAFGYVKAREVKR